MAQMRRSAWVLALLVAAAGCNQSTSLLLRISGPSTLTSIDISVVLASGNSAQSTLDVTGKPEPGTAVIVLPDIATQVNLSITGHTSDGMTLRTAAIVNSQPHQQLTVPIQLGPPLTDGGVPIDMAGAPSDLASTFQPRLIANAYFSNYTSTTYKSSGMSQGGYAIDTAGIVDGDLVFFIGSIDNGSNMIWPNPIAPGFTQIGQAYFGNDGQTFVVQYKIANNEPAQYSGAYGQGNGSGSATISLIAVSGVAANPINNTMVSFDPSTVTMTPVIGQSTGVTTTVPGCAILYMSGADWYNTPGMNTFTPPSGYTPLAQIGDHGNNMWDWTSQQVAYTIQPTAGPTGTISGTMLGTFQGNAWTVIVAVAPR
jgi:hypothetical protein